MRTDGLIIEDLRRAINGIEELAGDTPDHIIAELVLDCIKAVGKAIHARDAWYGVRLFPANQPLVPLNEEFAKKLAAVIEQYGVGEAPTESDLMLAFEKLQEST